MRQPTPAALNQLLRACAKGDVVAPYGHFGLLILEQRKLVESYLLFQPNGSLALSKRYSITPAGTAELANSDEGRG